MSSRHHRRSPDRHVLVARNEDVAELRLVLALLPGNAYGVVILDTDPTDASATGLGAPSRMSVIRVREGGLDDAVAAWAAEWMPEERCCTGDDVVWVGRQAATTLRADVRSRLALDFEPFEVTAA